MANFLAAKVGGWAARQKLSSTQLTHLQECVLKCPNFSEGSEHTLSGNLIVHGHLGGHLIATGADVRPYTETLFLTRNRTLTRPGVYFIESISASGITLFLDPPQGDDRLGATYVIANYDNTRSLDVATTGTTVGTVVGTNRSAKLVWAYWPSQDGSFYRPVMSAYY